MKIPSSRLVNAKRRLIARLSQPVVQFALAGLFAIALLGLVAALLINRAGRDEAIRDAKRITSLAGQGIVEPALGHGLLAGEPAAIRRMDRITEPILGHDGVQRIKIWDAESRIVYSDEHRLIGRKFALGADDLASLHGGGIDAGPTDLSSPENQYEDQSKELLEVYLPIRGPDEKPLLFETYIKSSFIASSGRQIFSTLAPVLIGALLVLAVLQLPLAASLARRLRRGQREREALLERSIDASETERRRIAQDLHDGVVQDLAGVSYSMSAAAERARSRGHELEEGELRDAATRTRLGIRDLRGLLLELYPPDLRRAGLRAAIADVASGVETRGVETEVTVSEDLDLGEQTEALLFRATQESLRNVVAHANARRVEVRIERRDGTACLEVADDGRGFSPAETRANGHFGLRTLADLARDAGGRLDVDSEPGGGTRVRLVVPAR